MVAVPCPSLPVIGEQPILETDLLELSLFLPEILPGSLQLLQLLHLAPATLLVLSLVEVGEGMWPWKKWQSYA